MVTSNLPDVIVDDDARSLLIGDMAKIRDGLLTVIGRQITKSGVSVGSIRISLRRNLEEDWEELVFRIVADANPDDAMAFWDSVGEAISKWRPTLSRRAQKLLDEKIGVFVEWP